MIHYLKGELLQKEHGAVVLLVQGVGYGIEVPTLCSAMLPPTGEVAELWIHMRVREDDIRLFGFSTKELKECFEILIGVSGVGPKVALSILGTLSVRDLLQAVESNNIGFLTLVPGIGRRSAEKILLELKTKLEKLQQLLCSLDAHSQQTTIRQGGTSEAYAQTQQQGRLFSKESLTGAPPPFAAALAQDLKSALLNLGYAERDIFQVLKELQKNYQGESLPLLVKAALKMFRQSAHP